MERATLPAKSVERDLIAWTNPCDGVSRNPEHSRDRYVTDDEYANLKLDFEDHVVTGYFDF